MAEAEHESDSAVRANCAIIKLLRSQKGMSQEVLAQKTGLSEKTIRRIEGGDPCYRTNLGLIATKGFGLPDCALLLLDEPSEPVKGQQGSPEMVHLRVKMDLNGKPYSFEIEAEGRREITIVLSDNEPPRIIMKDIGSVYWTLELTPEKAEKLRNAILEGKLAHVGIVDAEILGKNNTSHDESYNHDVYFCYSLTDIVNAKRIAKALTARGISISMERPYVAGSDYEKQIWSEIIKSRALLLICSPYSVHSEYILGELKLALQLTNQKHITIWVSEPLPLETSEVSQLISSSPSITTFGRQEAEWLPDLLSTLSRYGIHGASNTQPPPKPL